MCHNSSACHAYVLWVELSHSHFVWETATWEDLRVSHFENVVTTGNRCYNRACTLVSVEHPVYLTCFSFEYGKFLSFQLVYFAFNSNTFKNWTIQQRASKLKS